MQASITNIRAHASSEAASGIVLAAVLIILGITITLAIQAQVLARSYLVHAKAELNRAQLGAAAADGVWHALDILARDNLKLADHTNEEWAAPINIHLPDGIEINISITDQNRLLDANMLAYQPTSAPWRPPVAIVRDLLIAANMTEADRTVEIIRDWTDEDLEGNYENAYYQRRKSTFSPPNLPLESPEELFFLMNMTNNSAAYATTMAVLPAQNRRIEPVNVNSADRTTLLAIFGLNNKPIVERIISVRSTAPIMSLEQILDQETLKKFAPYLSVRSSFFSVHSRAKMGSDAEDVYCLAQRDAAGNIFVLRWVKR